MLNDRGNDWGGEDTSRSSVIKNKSCIIKKVNEDELTSGILFRFDSEVLQHFRADLFRPVDIPPELEIKR